MTFLIYPALLMMISGSVLTKSQNLDTKNCTIEEKDRMRFELCAELELIGVRDEDVILPCPFYHSRRDTISDLHFLLFEIKSSYENLVYNSASNYTSDDFKGRIEPVGNPSEADGLLRIRNLTMEDRGTFRCRFEWRKSNGDKDGFSVREGKYAKLQVDVHPKILRIEREFVNSSNSWNLFCEAEAKPEPNITWWNPQGLLLNASQMLFDQTDPNKPQKINSNLNITDKPLEGSYICLVQNKHGAAQGHVYFEFEEKSQNFDWTVVVWSTSLCLVLLLLLLFLLPIGFFLYTKKCKQQDRADLTATRNIRGQDWSNDKSNTAQANTSNIYEGDLYENMQL